MSRKFYKIEVGLTGRDEATTEFEQEVFLRHRSNRNCKRNMARHPN